MVQVKHDHRTALPDEDSDVVDAPRYWEMPFEECVRLLMERYGESSDSARLMMAIAQGRSIGDARAVATPTSGRRASNKGTRSPRAKAPER